MVAGGEEIVMMNTKPGSECADLYPDFRFLFNKVHLFHAASCNKQHLRYSNLHMHAKGKAYKYFILLCILFPYIP